MLVMAYQLWHISSGILVMARQLRHISYGILVMAHQLWHIRIRALAADERGEEVEVDRERDHLCYL